ncbi:MAG: tetratricopeptide (TPR) repeat protein [Cyclobacteriaceae bacterium]|jgi:tetratricopeptide (TPR) repeat protein
MMILLNILLLFFIDSDSKGIAEINNIKEKAEQAYKAGNYQQAAETYSYLVDTLSIADDKAIMNLGHSYYKLEDTEKALSSYERLQDSDNDKLRSQAYQQMGVLSKDPQTLEKALAYFKESIKSDPTNNDARYNYELLKKKLKEQEKQDENQQDQDKQDQDQDQEKDQEQQENKDSENQEKSDEQKKDQEQENKEQEQQDQENKENEEQEGQEQKDQEGKEEQKEQQEQKEGDEEQKKPQPGEEQEENEEDQKTPQQSTSEKLEKMNLSEEKAQMILEALKNSEIQYIQQNRRKPTKRKDSNKPDW